MEVEEYFPTTSFPWIPQEDQIGSTSLLQKNALNSFAFEYVNQHREDLGLYKSAKGFQDKFHIEAKIFSQFTEKSKNLDVIGSTLEIENSKVWIQTRLKALIGRQLFSDEGFYRAVNEEDKMIKKAIEIL
jgi:carboxyl-terminal processing protease